MRRPLPTDIIVFQCDHCKADLPLNVDGVLQVDKSLDTELSIVIDELSKSLLEAHYKQSEKCVASKMHIHPAFGTPQNIILSLPESDSNLIGQLKINCDTYTVDITVMTTDNKAIFVLYEKANDVEKTFSRFIECNFNTFLNIEPDKQTHQLEVWQLPIVTSIANTMISQQEEETQLVSNMKDMEKFIMKNIIDEESLPGNQQGQETLIESDSKEKEKFNM